MVMFVRPVSDFVRDKRWSFLAISSHARQGEAQTPPLLDHWLRAKLRRCALPSAFDFAVRAARDAVTRPIPGARPSGQRKRCSKTFPTFLSGAARAFATSCRSPGEVAHLSAVLTPQKTITCKKFCRQSTGNQLIWCPVAAGVITAAPRHPTLPSGWRSMPPLRRSSA